MNIIQKLKNPVLWVTIVALFISSTGFEWQEYTTWIDFFKEILNIFSNPVRIIAFIVALFGQFYHAGTTGIKD